MAICSRVTSFVARSQGNPSFVLRVCSCLSVRAIVSIVCFTPITAVSVIDGSLSVCPKVIQIKLEKDVHGSLGFLLRGGSCVDNLKSRPLTIVFVRPGGPTDREGTIKVGRGEKFVSPRVSTICVWCHTFPLPVSQ